MYFPKNSLLLLLTTQTVVEGFVTPPSRRSFGIINSQRSTTTFSEVDAEAITISGDESGGDDDSEETTTPPESLAIEDAVAAAVAEATGTPDVEITDSVIDKAIPSAEEPIRYTMYCKNIPFETTQVELTQILSAYGVISKVIMPTNPTTGSSRGFAFVDFESQEILDKAIEEADGVEINGRPLQCMPSLPQDQRPPKRTPGESASDRTNKIYVGNLPFGLENAQVEEIFGAHGTVADVYLMKDRVTGQDKGFGFVTMSSEEEVQKAIEGVNGSFFQGRRLVARVPLAKGERNPRKEIEADPLKRLYVGNLDYDVTEEQLLKTFNDQEIEVKTVYIARNAATGVSNGYGFASMTETEFNKAKETMNGFELNGRELRVEEAQNKVPKMRVYIGGIGYDTEPDAVEQVCRDYGAVTDFFMPRNPEFDGHKGFAIVTFEASVAEKFIEDNQQLEMDGTILSVSPARPKGEPGPPRNPRFGPPPDHPNAAKLYVGNLSFYTPAETLQSAFEEFGEVYEVYMPQEPNTESSRGFAFVSIAKEGAADAVKELNDAEVDGRYIVVDFARPRGEEKQGGGGGDVQDDFGFDDDDDDDVDDDF